MISEFNIFLMIILSGVFIGFCFDFYRIMRHQLRLNKVLTFMGDLLFSFLALFLIFYFAQRANFLELRFYVFGGSLLGLIIYLRFFSTGTKHLFAILLNLISKIKNSILGLLRMIYKGVAFILTSLMRIPYGILRWFALLLFRITQALGKESLFSVKRKIPRKPRQ